MIAAVGMGSSWLNNLTPTKSNTMRLRGGISKEEMQNRAAMLRAKDRIDGMHQFYECYFTKIL
eukprot:767131-Hanusia_phi.AAC.4